MKKIKCSKRKCKMYSFCKKIITKKLNVGGVLCAERDKEKYNKESARLRGRSQQLICQLIKRKRLMYYLFFKSNNIGKLMQM